MSDPKPGLQLGELVDQMLTVAQENPDEFVRSVKGGVQAFAENSIEVQRKVRNRGIQFLAGLARKKLFPDDTEGGTGK
jgi:hypothetical protein